MTRTPSSVGVWDHGKEQLFPARSASSPQVHGTWCALQSRHTSIAHTAPHRKTPCGLGLALCESTRNQDWREQRKWWQAPYPSSVEEPFGSRLEGRHLTNARSFCVAAAHCVTSWARRVGPPLITLKDTAGACTRPCEAVGKRPVLGSVRGACPIRGMRGEWGAAEMTCEWKSKMRVEPRFCRHDKYFNNASFVLSLSRALS